MKKFAMMFMAMLFLFILSAPAFSGDPYSTGWRAGVIQKASIKGNWTKSLEGELYMGVDSSRVEKKVGDAIYVINPWFFSDKENAGIKYMRLIGKRIWVKYDEVSINNPLLFSTPYRVKELGIKREYVWPKKLANEITYESSIQDDGKSRGVRIGRLVKLSKKGFLSKTWEAMLQVGFNGSTFIAMSVEDDPRFISFLESCLKSGEKLNIEYIEKGFMNISMEDTSYRIVRVERATMAKKAEQDDQD